VIDLQQTYIFKKISAQPQRKTEVSTRTPLQRFFGSLRVSNQLLCRYQDMYTNSYLVHFRQRLSNPYTVEIRLHWGYLSAQSTLGTSSHPVADSQVPRKIT